MKRSIARKWAKALDSGEYKQGTGELRGKGNKFCCLGVLCNLHAQAHPEIAKKEKTKGIYLGETDLPPSEVMDWSGLQNDEGVLNEAVFINYRSIRTLVELNDVAKLTFPEIAKIIRKHWKEL